ncbi:two-component system QseEF-associated lipoprotein QseG [Providencia sneebia]|nr:two-component system QseEF-associated lipoprotein QseG [Providencia sneebia]
MSLKQYVGLTNKIKISTQKPKIIQLSLLFFSFVLAGCATKSGHFTLDTLSQVVVSEVKVTDYRYTACENIWDNDQPSARDNALFWLRMMSCADNLEPTKAREDAALIKIENWSEAFQQSILMGAAEPTIAERRKMVDNMNTFSLHFPTGIRPLLQLWREQQVQMINLAEANARFKRLQLETDNKLDRIKETNAKLEFELKTTSRKLENLTDIERQLSSRKQSTNETEKDVESTGEKQEEEQAITEKPVAEAENKLTSQPESERNDNP